LINGQTSVHQEVMLMSWLLHLYETYEANLDQVGKIEKKGENREYTLLPISHTTQNAHIEVTVDEDGEFLQARVLNKENTIIPCTEESASRSSNPAPYPLHDKLVYVAGDYVKYGGKIKKKDEIPYDLYIRQLEDWATSPYATKKVVSIYKYLRKGCLIEDLVRERVLFLDDNNHLLEKWDPAYEPKYGNKPAIYSSGASDLSSAFVRFNVYIPESMDDVWKDREVYESFIAYYNQKLDEPDICYITQKRLPSTEKHPNKIRHPADMAKLISANDDKGYTYRGRFHDSKQAASISYEVSQKAHNALKWLINRQGKSIDDRVFLVWATDGSSVPHINDDAVDFMVHNDREPVRDPETGQLIATEVSKAIDGYRNDLSYQTEVNILVLDSATTGRMAVLYYRHLNKELYLKRLEHWHTTCAWQHRYRKNKDEIISFYGAPATKDIAYAAYGTNANEKIIKGLMERVLPCIVDGRSLPVDIVRSVFYRASNPVSMDRWEWEKTLTIACSLIRRSLLEKKEEWSVALNTESRDRSYLFGRLLAVADVLERTALGKDESRATNAIRYMNSYAQCPARTWKTIQASLQPYQARLGIKATYLSKLIDDIGNMFEFDDFNNEPLTEKYLLGFYSQRHELYKKKEEDKNDENSGSQD
jgi:CRISPR-associated protein Csd1